MPYLTLTLIENLKLQLSPGLVASYDIQPGNGVGLFWDKHTHTRLLTYLLAPDPYVAPLMHRKLYENVYSRMMRIRHGLGLSVD